MPEPWDVDGVFIGTVRGRKSIRRVRLAVRPGDTAWHIEPFDAKRPAVISPNPTVRKMGSLLIDELADDQASRSNQPESPEARQAG